MTLEKINLFTISVYKIKNFIDDNIRNNIINYIKNNINLTDKHKLLSDNSNSTHFSNEKYIIDKIQTDLKECVSFKNKIQNVINETANKIGYENCILTNSWINIQRKDSYLHRHNHGDSSISGVLFLKVDELSSRIFFYNTNPYVSVNHYLFLNDNNFEHFSFKPNNGDLFLFPGWLQHGSNTDVNKSEERIALSFNSKIQH